jgi:hypothetical protein
MANWGSMRSGHVSTATKSSVTNKESVIKWLDTNISILEKRGNLDPVSNKGVSEIRAWSMVSGNDRVLLLKCKNKKVYQSQEEAEQRKSVFYDNNDYKSVLQQLKNIRQVFDSVAETNKVFKFWVRVKSKEDKSVSVIQL